MLSITLTIPEKTISEIDEKRGDIPRSKFVSKLLERALKEVPNAKIIEFLVDWKKGIKGEFRVTLEDIHGYHNKNDFEDRVLKPLLRKLSIDENDSELSRSIKYPGEY